MYICTSVFTLYALFDKEGNPRLQDDPQRESNTDQTSRNLPDVLRLHKETHINCSTPLCKTPLWMKASSCFAGALTNYANNLFSLDETPLYINSFG